MSKSMASKNAQKQELIQEITVLQIALDDALMAYSILKRAIDKALEDKYEIMHVGRLGSTAEMFERLENDSAQAEQFANLSADGRDTFPPVSCSRCAAFIDGRSNQAARCPVCNHRPY